jgi:predicted enzyme related to lactoylglutathione lyase
MYIKFFELPVTDQSRALVFYLTALRAEVVQDRSYGEDGWRWLEVALPQGQTHLLLSGKGGVQSERPALVLVDADLESAAERLRGTNAQMSEIGFAPWDSSARYLEFTDSEGNRLIVTER